MKPHTTTFVVICHKRQNAELIAVGVIANTRNVSLELETGEDFSPTEGPDKRTILRVTLPTDSSEARLMERSRNAVVWNVMPNDAVIEGVHSLHAHDPAAFQKTLRDMRWDSINGCWMAEVHGMAVGIETDGYVHS